MVTNVDPVEIRKFEDLGTHWWDKTGPLHTLHSINPMRLAFIKEQMDLEGSRVLDVGCGGGILSETLQQAGAQVTGIDASPNAIEAATLHAQEEGLGVEYHCTTLESMDQKTSGSYDVITCMEMLEHVPDAKSLVQTCQTYLKPGGKAFFSTLNRNIKAYFFAIVGAEYILQWLPQGTHQYHQFIKPSELAHWLREANLSLKKMEGISYNLLQKSFSRTKDLSVNYMVYCEK